MATLPHQSPVSVEAYLQLDRSSLEERFEYIDGYITLQAGGTANHATIGFNAARVLHSLLRGSPCRVYNSDLRVKLSEQRYVYPDACVSCDTRDRGQIDSIHYPRLIVEVLSPGTEAYDRGRKFAYYRGCPTIQEYVLIDTQRYSVEVFHREADTRWTLDTFGRDDEVKLLSLGISFPIAALYEDVIFPEGYDS